MEVRRGLPASPPRFAVLAALAIVALAACARPARTGAAGGQGGIEPAEAPPIPDLAQVWCDTEGTHVLTPSVRPRPDGVHIQVDNRSGQRLGFSIDGPQGPDGGTNADPGVTEPESPVGGPGWQIGPGTVHVLCRTFDRDGGDHAGEQPLTVADSEKLFVPDRLQCAGGSVTGFSDYAEGATGPHGDPVDLARAHFRGLRPTDVVERARYPQDAYPVVRVTRDGSVIATIAYLPDGQGGWLQDTVSRCSDSGLVG